MKRTNSHKKIGILGGLGPQATSFIYNYIIELSQKKYGAKHNSDFPRLIIESVPVPDFISDTSDIVIAKKMLIEATKNLAAAGATKFCIGSNTVHILLEDLTQETDIEFISMIRLVAEHCHQRGLKNVGLLGSPVLLGSGLYTSELNKFDIETILPTASQVETSEKIIRAVIAGEQNDPNKLQYINNLNDLFLRGAESIILGCTELPLAVNYEALGSRTINSEAVLAEGIVDYYYSA